MLHKEEIKLKKLISLVVGTILINSLSFATFTDIDTLHWGYEAVDNMASIGILSGYPDGSFMPNKNITLAEYASIFNNFFEIESNLDDDYFPNINNSHWAKGKIEAIREYIQPNYDNISESLNIDKQAFEYGIVADIPVTREVVIYSLSSILALDNSDYVPGEEKIFADYEKILYPEVAVILYKNGIISGENVNNELYLAPDRYITRVEIASMFNKLLVGGEKVSNTETIEDLEETIKNIIILAKEYKLNDVKEYIYDSANILNNIDFNNFLNKDIKNIIDKYFNKLKYDVVDYGFYSYNKAYITLNKKSYDYSEIVKCLKNINLTDLNESVNQISKVASKLKPKIVETAETINFIKNNNEWKIEL